MSGPVEDCEGVTPSPALHRELDLRYRDNLIRELIFQSSKTPLCSFCTNRHPGQECGASTIASQSIIIWNTVKNFIFSGRFSALTAFLGGFFPKGLKSNTTRNLVISFWLWLSGVRGGLGVTPRGEEEETADDKDAKEAVEIKGQNINQEHRIAKMEAALKQQLIYLVTLSRSLLSSLLRFLLFMFSFLFFFFARLLLPKGITEHFEPGGNVQGKKLKIFMLGAQNFSNRTKSKSSPPSRKVDVTPYPALKNGNVAWFHASLENIPIKVVADFGAGAILVGKNWIDRMKKMEI